jgi:pseudouridine-5'-phosphate glycosidase/pseudouridine kinase
VGDTPRESDVIVAGALAVDYSCDYAPLPGSASQNSPSLHTSNPAQLYQSLGGVAHNIARAAHLLGANVKLCSIVGDDLASRTALQQLEAEGMDRSNIQTVDGERTAQYVAVNDAQKDLVVAMADMGILEREGESLVSKLREAVRKETPKWLAVDGNLDSKSLQEALKIGKAAGAKTAFEPVSTAKSVRIFESQNHRNGITARNQQPLPAFPNHLVDVVTPNHLELAAMHSAAREASYFERQDWWKVIDAMGIPASGARSRFAMSTTREMVDQGIPQQSVQLLPFMPCILTKLGPKGVLLSMLLSKEDERLRDGNIAPYIISRSRGEDSANPVGGVYMRLFSPLEMLSDADVISVNGVGDTFLGALIAAAVKTGKSVEDLVDFAQRAALLTLRSREAVNPALRNLRSLL